MVGLSICQWLPCPLAIWNLLFGMAILLNLVKSLTASLRKRTMIEHLRERPRLSVFWPMRWLLSRSATPMLSNPNFFIVAITRSFVTSFVVSGMPEMRRFGRLRLQGFHLLLQCTYVCGQGSSHSLYVFESHV